MAKKRTKADKAMRGADRAEKRTESRPEHTRKKPREDFSQAAARIVREATQDR